MGIKSSIVFATVGLYRKVISCLELQCVHFFMAPVHYTGYNQIKNYIVQRHVKGEKVPSVGAVGVIECKKNLCAKYHKIPHPLVRDCVLLAQ